VHDINFKPVYTGFCFFGQIISRLSLCFSGNVDNISVLTRHATAKTAEVMGMIPRWRCDTFTEQRQIVSLRLWSRLLSMVS